MFLKLYINVTLDTDYTRSFQRINQPANGTGLRPPYPLMVDLDVGDKDLLLVIQVHDDLLAPVLGDILHLITPILDKHRETVNFYRFPNSVLRYLYTKDV